MTAAKDPGPLFLDGLRRAVADDEIEILFQPQVEFATGRIVGAEALARWQQPDLGELSAETLFGAAARAGFSAELSEYVQRRAIAAAAAWPDDLGHLRLSINIMAADTVRESFGDELLASLGQNDFDRQRLIVEVTETELIENLDTAAALLTRLRGHGIQVSLDDFGTGYSSLLYLKVLPLDALKIDKRLTEDITGSERDRVVLRCIIAMGRTLGLKVVAEGVETEEQRSLLAAEGCDFYQGYFCSPPVDSASLVALVRR
jgi:EAL domain-containing protein (putative c-di-GMP-specific phosphodiesterase class I)